MTRNMRRLAPLAGVVYVGLMVALLSLPSSPDAKASGQKVVSFLSAHHTSVHVADFVLAYAAIALVVYFASLATYLRRRGAQILSTTTIGGAVMAAAGLCVAAGINESEVDQYKRLSPTAAQTLNLLNSDLFAILLFAGLCLATTSAGISMLRTASFPKAVGIITIVIGAGFGTGFAAWIAFMASGLLTLYVAGYLFRQYSRPEQITMPDVPAARVTTDVPVTVAETTSG